MWVREAWEWQSHDLADRTLAAYWQRTLTVLLSAVCFVFIIQIFYFIIIPLQILSPNASPYRAGGLPQEAPKQ
jgi:hypothetical protein